VPRRADPEHGPRQDEVDSDARLARHERRTTVNAIRTESDSLGQVSVPADKLWGAQTQRSLEHFSIGQDLIPREMITAYAILKKAAATANHAGRRLADQPHALIVQTCDEILAGQHTTCSRCTCG
jgi:fumarate hydratase class II